MKILIIAPLPPPIHGHSLISQLLVDELSNTNEVSVADMAKKSLKEGVSSPVRFFEIFKVFYAVFKNIRNKDRIYFTISESLAGNLKDLFIYLLCFRKLSSTYIHLHGGSIKKLLFDKYPLLYQINKIFIKRLGGIIISGPSHKEIFNKIIQEDKIHYLYNFAESNLFISNKELESKNQLKAPIKILYMSAMIDDKGYKDIFQGFIRLTNDVREQFELNFAGKFANIEDENTFLQEIKNYSNISYHGIVDSKQKEELFKKSHIFCLPTKFFEGQPLSILEAYASGCFVITTAKGGIIDIFEDGKNGCKITENDPDSISKVLIDIANTRIDLDKVSRYNLENAYMVYNDEAYFKNIKQILKID